MKAGLDICSMSISQLAGSRHQIITQHISQVRLSDIGQLGPQPSPAVVETEFDCPPARCQPPSHTLDGHERHIAPNGIVEVPVTPAECFQVLQLASAMGYRACEKAGESLGAASHPSLAAIGAHAGLGQGRGWETCLGYGCGAGGQTYAMPLVPRPTARLAALAGAGSPGPAPSARAMPEHLLLLLLLLLLLPLPLPLPPLPQLDALVVDSRFVYPDYLRDVKNDDVYLALKDYFMKVVEKMYPASASDCDWVVCRPRGTDQRRGRVVLVDEHRTSRVSSAVNGQQPCESRLSKRRATRPADWKPPAGQVEQRLMRPAWSQQRDQPVRGLMWCPVVAPRKPPQAPRSSQEATQTAASEPGPSTPQPAKRSKRTKAEPAAEPTKGKGKGKAAKAKPAPQPGRWLDRDCNVALNMQRIGESRWRPLELCYWPDQGALPAKGKEYPGLGYKRLRDKPPKAQQQQQQPAVAQ
ncbi:hypothetical protein QJQ45_005596 [Haematococcus lacustris]|nr:hypothetical protein QJQ45_005596 [Haematococcus lacustris]